MTLTTNSIARHLKDGRPRGLCALTDDILLDFVLANVSVRDVLALRGTCRTLYNLTHHPTVWKRILRSFGAPLPPLPPTSRFSLGRLSSLETERLVTRALSADVNWRSERPRAWQVWKVPLFWQVLSVKLLPGGQHMVASVKRARQSYGLLVVQLDHRQKTAYPIAMFASGAVKPYALEAKYMDFEGEPRIMISYISRECAHQRDRESGVDVQDFSDRPDFDYPVRVRYELVVLHCSLDVLQNVEGASPGTPEYMAKMMENPTVFKVATVIRSNSPFELTELDVRIEREGDIVLQDPCIVWVQGDCVKLKNLRTREMSSFTCGPVENNHDEPVGHQPFRIRAIRMLPPQGEFLIVRTADVAGLALQLFTIPPPGVAVTNVAPRQQRLHTEEQGTPGRVHVEIAISAHNIPLPRDTSLLATLAPHAEPPPLYVYTISESPWGATMFRLWPQRVRLESARDFSDALDVDAFAAEVEGAMYDADASSDDDDDDPFSEPRQRRTGAPRSKQLLEDTTFRYSVRPILNSYIIPNAFTHDFIAPTTAGTPGAPTAEMSQRLRILPGCVRALLVGTDPEDRSLAPKLLNLHAFADMHPSVRREARWPDDVRREEAASRRHGWVKDTMQEREGLNAIAPLLYGVADVQEVFEKGVAAVGWDDWAARICMIPQAMPTTAYLLEFAHTPREDPCGHRLPLPVPYDFATELKFSTSSHADDGDQSSSMDWEAEK